MSPNYISFSELIEGRARLPDQVHADAIGLFKRDLCEDIDNSRYFFILAEAEGQIMGFALASLDEQCEGVCVCWLDDVCIRPDKRNEGIATRLWQEIRHWGQEQGALHFLLESGIRNTEAHAFFKKKGFQPLATVFWMSGEG